jgi:hypothetical protein
MTVKLMTKLCAAAAVAASGAAASAQQFNFPLTGAQQVPANNSNAAGAAQLLYDSGSETFDLDLMVFGIGLNDLLGVGPNSTPVHIHNAPAGSNGPIVIDIGNLGSFVQDGLGIRLQLDDVPIGNFEPELFAGELYVNIHTNAFPGGQIRGQIVPAPGALALLAGAGVLATRRRRR